MLNFLKYVISTNYNIFLNMNEFIVVKLDKLKASDNLKLIFHHMNTENIIIPV